MNNLTICRIHKVYGLLKYTSRCSTNSICVWLRRGLSAYSPEKITDVSASFDLRSAYDYHRH